VHRDYNNVDGVIVEFLILMIIVYSILQSVTTFCDNEMHQVRSILCFEHLKGKEEDSTSNKCKIPHVSINYKECKRILVAVAD